MEMKASTKKPGKLQTLLKELKERRIVQILFCYAIGAFGFLAGVYEITSDNRIRSAALILCITGIPVVAIAAWFHGKGGRNPVTKVEFFLITLCTLIGGSLTVKTLVVPTPITILIRMMDPRVVTAIETPDSLASPMLDLLGVRYIAAGAAADIPVLEEKGFPLAFYDEEEGLGLFENPDALPRAFIVTRCSMVSGASGEENNAADQALALVSSPAFKPDQEVVLEAPLPADFEPGPDPMNRAPDLTIEDYQPIEIIIRADLFDARGFLVLTDNWYPGWEALINGAPAEIYRANYTFRAVPLPEGEHEIVFRYRPMSRTLGMMGTFLSLGVILCWSIVLGWKGPLSRSRKSQS